MDIRITWDNPNAVYEKITIHRAQTPIDKTNLPEQIGEVAFGINEYIDTGLVQGGSYYYAVRVIDGDDFVVSDVLTASTVSYTGPFDQLPVIGDMDLGYFGYYPADSFLSTDQLRSIFEPVLNKPVGWVTPGYWIKFAYKGKVLIFPTQSVNGCTWGELYNAGLVYGDDVPDWETKTVPQNFTLNVGQDTFIVRLFKLTEERRSPDYKPTPVTWSTVVALTESDPLPSGEYTDIMDALCVTADKEGLTDISNAFHTSGNNLFVLQDAVHGSEDSLKFAFGERITANAVYKVKFNTEYNKFFPYFGGRGPINSNNWTALDMGLTGVNFYKATRWLPVFELVQ